MKQKDKKPKKKDSSSLEEQTSYVIAENDVNNYVESIDKTTTPYTVNWTTNFDDAIWSYSLTKVNNAISSAGITNAAARGGAVAPANKPPF